MKLGRRLAVVEKTIGSAVLRSDAPTYGEELARRRQADWEIMRPAMREDHAHIVGEAYAAGFSGYGSPGVNTPAERLLNHCLALMMWADNAPDSRIPSEVALAVPPVVAEVYHYHSDVGTLHDCEDCGYKVPYKYFAPARSVAAAVWATPRTSSGMGRPINSDVEARHAPEVRRGSTVPPRAPGDRDHSVLARRADSLLHSPSLPRRTGDGLHQGNVVVLSWDRRQ